MTAVISIRKIALTLCCTLLLTACIAEDVVPVSGESSGAVTVQLSVNTGALSRAEVAPETDEAKIHTLRVYIFTEDGKPAGHFYTSTADYKPATGATEGTIPASIFMDMVVYSEPQQKVRFYVIANEGAVNSSMTGWEWSADLTEADINDYYFTSVTNSIKTSGLPMYCKTDVITLNTETKAVNTEPGHENHYLVMNDPVTLSLERPVAKLNLFAAKEEGETAVLTILSAKILSQGQTLRNYFMPQADLENAELLWGLSEADYLLPIVTTNTVEAELTPESSYSGDDYNAYRSNMDNYDLLMGTPYYANENPYGSDIWSKAGTGLNATRGNILEVTYQFSDGEEKTGTVYLPKIERNRYYTVLCLMTNGANGGMSVEYSVADWEDAENQGIMNFAYPTYTNPLTPFNVGLTSEHQIALGADGKYPQPTVFINNEYVEEADGQFSNYFWSDWQNDGTVRFSFKITAPEGMKWSPTLTASEGFKVNVFKKNVSSGSYTLVEGSDALVAGEDYEYVLVVRARKVEGTDEHATSTELMITYDTSDWSYATQNSLLMINGAAGETKWTGSSDPETIKILFTEEGLTPSN